MALDNLQITPRTQLVRKHQRANYDRSMVSEIIDATPLCHVSYIIDGRPYVTPTLQWREGDRIFWHGSSASRFLRQIEGKEACLVVTHFDGLVLARSAFHHSVNYRSAMLFGVVSKVATRDKEAHLQKLLDGLFPGRWDILRPITAKEAKATVVLSMLIDEGSAKVRTGPPNDDDEDYGLPIWAGVLPIGQTVHVPESDPRNLPGIEAPDHVGKFRFR